MKTIHLINLLLILSMITGITIQGHSAVLPDGVISGTVRYTNADSTVIRHARVMLTDDQNIPVDSAFTDADGSFTFADLAQGSYTLTACPVHPAGGINAVDAFEVLKHFVGMVTLEGLPLIAADVNLSAAVNSVDALLVQKMFVELIPSFPAAEWVSEQATVSLNPSDTISLTLLTICTGDVNGSYVPDNNLFLFCGDTLLDVRDGQKYPTVQIGNQCWMQKNLNIGLPVNSSISMSDNSVIEKYCYDDDTGNCSVYGGLYQWDEMMNYTYQQDNQGICPQDWHIPSEQEWCALSASLDPTEACTMDSSNCCILWGATSFISGGKMKEQDFQHWCISNTSATNETGFTAIGGGLYCPPAQSGNGFEGKLGKAYFWSSTSILEAYAISRNIFCLLPYFYRSSNFKSIGNSVRCLKD